MSEKNLSKLFYSFLKIGAFSFGGGVAMIPLILRETVHKNHWIEEGDMLDMIAIAESTPGPIAVNAATFVGYKAEGTAGALCATAGVTLPSFIIIYVISFALSRFEELRAVRYAFFGIRAGVCAMLIGALVSIYKQCPKNAFAYTLMALAFAAAVFGISPVIIIAVCGTAGIIRTAAERRRHK